MQSLLFVFSVLGLLGVLLLTTTVTNNTSQPDYFNAIYAQDEDEDNDKDSSKDKDEEEEEEEESSSSKDEEKDDENQESEESSNETSEEFDNPSEEQAGGAAIAEPLEELSDLFLDVTETKQELQEQAQQVLTEEQQVKEQLNNILVAGNWTNPQTNTSQPIPEPEPTEEPIFKNLTNYYHQTLLDPSCNCTNPQIEPPSKSVLPPTVSPPPQGLQQIIINPGSVKSLNSWGEIKDPNYTNFYTVNNTIDNKIDSLSFWSQYGKSGFNIELYPEALQNYEVCHAEVVVHNPKGAQSTLTINSDQNYTGILDNTTEKVDFNTCMKNVDEIGMSFDAPKKYTSIGELKLFGKLVNQQPTLTTTPTPTTIPQPSNSTKIEIKDSNAIIDIINSTVTFKFDPQSAQATNYNVITIPNTEVVN